MDYQNIFIEKFEELCNGRGVSKGKAWESLITMCACSFSNVFGEASLDFKQREREFAQYQEVLGGFERPAELLSIITLALEENPKQDFLGTIFQKLKLNDSRRGQIFTPYHVAELMSRLTCNTEFGDKDWLSVCDPCVGAGVMLIAASNVYRDLGINYQTDILFVGQDIDRTVALMSYVQLSLLGCPGYVIVGNSLTEPVVRHPLFPQVNEECEIWYTPMFFRKEWEYRRMEVLL